jgi:uncharacterized protein
MQPTQDLKQNTVEEILDAHLALLATDTEAWIDLLDEDVIVDFPYAPSLGRPGRLEGKAATYNHVKTALTQMQNLTFTNVRKYPTTDPNVLWAELHGSALIPATGRHYEQDYVVRIQIRDGKIVYYSEYWNPMALMNAFGDTPVN